MNRPTALLLGLLAVATTLSTLLTAVTPAPSDAARDRRRQVSAEVVAGYDVSDGKYPFVAAIGSSDPSGAFLRDNQFCGGSLIAPSYVLTAAHCVVGWGPERFAVVVGRTVMSSNQGEVRFLTGITIHPSYNPGNSTNDIAVLRLNQPVTTIQPVALVGANNGTFDAGGASLTLAGWGDTVPDPHHGRPGQYPDRLRELQVSTVDDTTCAKQWRRTGYNDSSVWPLFFCTTAGRFGYSDSGSPLFATVNGAPVQVSLVSGGYVDKSKNTKHKKNRKPLRNIPDYGPQLSAPSSAGFIATAIGA